MAAARQKEIKVNITVVATKTLMAGRSRLFTGADDIDWLTLTYSGILFNSAENWACLKKKLQLPAEIGLRLDRAGWWSTSAIQVLLYFSSRLLVFHNIKNS